MPRGEKSKDTGKQRRQAEHIEEGYERRGVGKDEAERRAWATVNKTTGGGKKRGSGVGKRTNKAPARKGGRSGGAAAAARSSRARLRPRKRRERGRAGRRQGSRRDTKGWSVDQPGGVNLTTVCSIAPKIELPAASSISMRTRSSNLRNGVFG